MNENAIYGSQQRLKSSGDKNVLPLDIIDELLLLNSIQYKNSEQKKKQALIHSELNEYNFEFGKTQIKSPKCYQGYPSNKQNNLSSMKDTNLTQAISQTSLKQSIESNSGVQIENPRKSLTRKNFSDEALCNLVVAACNRRQSSNRLVQTMPSNDSNAILLSQRKKNLKTADKKSKEIIDVRAIAKQTAKKFLKASQDEMRANKNQMLQKFDSSSTSKSQFLKHQRDIICKETQPQIYGIKLLNTQNTSARGKQKQPTQGATNINLASKNVSTDVTNSQHQQPSQAISKKQRQLPVLKVKNMRTSGQRIEDQDKNKKAQQEPQPNMDANEKEAQQANPKNFKQRSQILLTENDEARGNVDREHLRKLQKGIKLSFSTLQLLNQHAPQQKSKTKCLRLSNHQKVNNYMSTNAISRFEGTKAMIQDTESVVSFQTQDHGGNNSFLLNQHLTMRSNQDINSREFISIADECNVIPKQTRTQTHQLQNVKTSRQSAFPMQEDTSHQISYRGKTSLNQQCTRQPQNQMNRLGQMSLKVSQRRSQGRKGGPTQHKHSNTLTQSRTQSLLQPMTMQIQKGSMQSLGADSYNNASISATATVIQQSPQNQRLFQSFKVPSPTSNKIMPISLAKENSLKKTLINSQLLRDSSKPMLHPNLHNRSKKSEDSKIPGHPSSTSFKANQQTLSAAGRQKNPYKSAHEKRILEEHYNIKTDNSKQNGELIFTKLALSPKLQFTHLKSREVGNQD